MMKRRNKNVAIPVKIMERLDENRRLYDEAVASLKTKPLWTSREVWEEAMFSNWVDGLLKQYPAPCKITLGAKGFVTVEWLEE